jgi:N-acetylglucosaminyldiphosphoundecaprenol N-acetyl-beta-D-mannosaminyltransferase
MRQLCIILGLPIDELTMESALARIEEFIAHGRAHGKSHQIATVNADFVVKAMSDPNLRAILQEADMATADGMPLVWGARLLGVPLQDRVTGADMVPALAELSGRKGYSIFFLGAAPGVAASAAEILRERHPGLQVAGVLSPPKATVEEMDPSIITKVNAAKPDILLVAFGNPKQEKWIAMHAHELQVPVMIGIGGTLDFIAGKTKRAPRWMQQSGTEWIYRLLQEPRRMWRRYVGDMIHFTPFFIRQWWLMRQGNKPALLLPHSELVMVGKTAVLNVQGRLERSNVAAFRERAAEGMVDATRLIINLEQCDFLDSMALGALVATQKEAREQGVEMVITAVPPDVMRSIKLLKLDQLFTIQPSVTAVLEAGEGAGTLDTTQFAEWTVLPLPDRFDDAAADRVMSAGLQSLMQNPALILDFSHTEFLSNAGMQTVVNLRRAAQRQGGQVRLVGCSADISQTLKTSANGQELTIYRDIQAAAD